MVDNKEIVEILVKLVEAFESLGISYHVGGSVVSSFYGDWRATDDIDIVADIQLSSVNRLVQKLEDEFYIDADMIRDAIRRKSSFNVIFLASMQKADIFIRKSHPFAQQEYLRSRPEIIAEGTRPFLLASPEDTILNKLDWYKMGNEISTRQWNDILGILKQQGIPLDFAYLRHWASNLGVANLLQREFSEAGIQE